MALIELVLKKNKNFILRWVIPEPYSKRPDLFTVNVKTYGLRGQFRLRAF